MSEKISYTIFNPRNIFYPNEIQLKNQCYEAWFKLWDSVYSEKKSDFKLKSDEFIRQDLVAAILVDGNVAALHMYSMYDLQAKADLNTHYFEFFPETYLAELRKRNVRTAMSMEFLTVVPQYRKAFMNGISMGKVIGNLGVEIFATLGLDAIIAPARNDVKVNDMAYDVGFDCIQKATMQRGFECDLIACFKGRQKASEDPKNRAVVDQLWKEKVLQPSAQWLAEINNPNIISIVHRKAA